MSSHPKVILVPAKGILLFFAKHPIYFKWNAFKWNAFTKNVCTVGEKIVCDSLPHQAYFGSGFNIPTTKGNTFPKRQLWIYKYSG